MKQTNIYKYMVFNNLKRYFDDNVYAGKISIDEAEMDQSNLLKNVLEFNVKSRPRKRRWLGKKGNAFNSVNALYEGLELTLNASKSGIFAIKLRKGEWLKILTPKQTLQRLPVAFTPVKASGVFY